MRIVKIAVLLILGVVLVSGIACGGDGGTVPTPKPTPTPTTAPTPIPTPTHTPTLEMQVKSCDEAYTAVRNLLDNLAQTPSSALALSNYWAALYYTSCQAYDEDYNPLWGEYDKEQVDVFAVSHYIAPVEDIEPWDTLLEWTTWEAPAPDGTYALCMWWVSPYYPESAYVGAADSNAAVVWYELRPPLPE